MKRMAIFLIFSLIVLFLSCATSKTNIEENPGPYPYDYKKIIKNYIEKSFFDPYSIRSAKISSPVGYRFQNDVGWLVCIEANAKNRMGGYTGLKRTGFMINSGKIINDLGEFPICYHENISFIEWPEIDSDKH